MPIIKAIVEFFMQLFGLDDTHREMKRIFAPIAHFKPPYYRFKNNIVMPGFAQDLYLFSQALKPLMDLADRTLAHPDLRVSRRYFDYLVEADLPPAELERKESFFYDGMKLRVENAVRADKEQEIIGKDFQRFLKDVEDLVAGPLNTELADVERFIDICRHDWERVLGFFDPGVNLEEAKYKPDFQPCDGEQLLPELVDVNYLLSGFYFSPHLMRKVMRVFDRYAPASAASQAGRIEKMFGTLNKVLQYRLSNESLMALIRLIKRDGLFQPDLRRERINYVEQYKQRLVTQYERDRERLLRERHENAVSKDIKDLLSGIEVVPVEAYEEENDSYLRRETPYGFTHIKPLGILKTFTTGIFDQQIKETVKKILVEGYFDNKSFQNNLANILYQCDRTIGRITAFEESLRSNGRVSMSAVRRYVEEMRHGKDIMPFLEKLVEEINLKAREICEDETGLFEMLGSTMGELLADYRKSSPDLVTNIRTLGGVRNKEYMAALVDGRKKIETFVRVMRNFAFVKTPSSLPGAPEVVNAVVEAAPIEPVESDISQLEELGPT
ncbi:MAG: DUF5312 family protein [Clostridia bacterium]|jgi:hypothetical protein